MRRVIKSTASLSPTSTSSTETPLNTSLIVEDEPKKDDKLDVYECQKCEEWMAEPLREITVHRFDTIRTLNNGRSVVGEWLDTVLVCPECYGGLKEDGAKVGFSVDAGI